MTGKERLTRLFSGKDIDRVPIWMLFPVNPTPFAVDVRNIASYKPVLGNVYGKTDFIERRPFDCGFCINTHEAITIKSKILSDNGTDIYKEIVSYKDSTLERCYAKTDDKLQIKTFVNDVDDLDRIIAMPCRIPEPNIGLFQIQKEMLGDMGIMAVMLPDSISVLHDLCDETDFIMMCYSETDKVIEFLDAIHERAMEYCRKFLDRDTCDLFWISGSEFAVPPMLSPDYFNKLVVKYQKELVNLIRSYGKKTMIHCHGRIEKVLDGFAKINPNSLHPIEAPPMGDCTLTRAREALGGEIILTGNLQYGDLWEKSGEEIEIIVKKVVEEGKKGPFILAMTASPTMPEIDERVAKNYNTIVETAVKIGCY